METKTNASLLQLPFLEVATLLRLEYVISTNAASTNPVFTNMVSTIMRFISFEHDNTFMNSSEIEYLAIKN